ncbi:MAG: SDR family NAD(P)-dependent oxidoreductase [Myxococcota bacterium]
MTPTTTPRTALVTGGNRGLGLASATRLARQGFHVVLGVRTLDAGDRAAATIRAAVPDATVDVMRLDLSSLASVRAFAERWHARGLPLHLLLANAGILGHPTLARSVDGHELHFATNHLGHFLLVDLLRDVLQASAPARVVVVSSVVHIEGQGPGKGPAWSWDHADGFDPTPPYDPYLAYKNSKLANLWFTYALSRRLQGTGVTVNALCPGFVPATGVEQQQGLQRFLFRWVFPWMPFARSIEQAATHIAWVCTAPELDGVSGRFYADRKERASSDQARDEALQERLWALSERLVAAPAASAAAG